VSDCEFLDSGEDEDVDEEIADFERRLLREVLPFYEAQEVAFRRFATALADFLNLPETEQRLRSREQVSTANFMKKEPPSPYLAADKIAQTMEHLLRVGQQAAQEGEQTLLSDSDRRLVEEIANTPWERVELATCPDLTPDQNKITYAHSMLYFWSLPVGIARGICAVLSHDVRLLRCPAPAPGHSNPAIICGRYFVSGGKVGRPANFCSEACTKRDSRVRKKVAERAGVR